MNRFDKYIFKEAPYYSRKIVRVCSGFTALKLKKYNVIPESIVMLGFAIGLMSAYFYSKGTYASILFASLLYSLAWFLDFVDGDLARVSNKVSEKGEWLDSASGKILEMAIYFGVCLGLSKTSQSSNTIWITGFIVVLLHYIIVSLMTKESILKLKFPKGNISASETETSKKIKKRNILKVILREFTVGPDVNGWFIIFGGLTNMLMPALILCLLNNICYLDRKSTRLNSSHIPLSRMPSSA